MMVTERGAVVVVHFHDLQVVVGINVSKAEVVLPDTGSDVLQVNYKMVPSFTMKGVVFLSPKQIHIAEVCAGEKLQQLERTDSVGRSKTAYFSIDIFQSGTEKLTDKGSDVNLRHEDGSSTWQSRFHFEEAWLHDAETKGIIKKGWQQL
ncbi:hypothetical protein ACOSQ2_023376 [Xanthoceras sorbifolium]